MRNILISAAFVLLFGCNPSTTSTSNLQTENDNLRIEVSELKAELNSLKYGPANLLNSSKIFYDRGEYASAQNQIKTLLQKHPDSNESIDASDLQKKIDQKLAEQKRERESKDLKDKAAENDRLANATKGLLISHDEIAKLTRYEVPNQPITETHIAASIVKTQNETPLLLKYVQYADDDWLFVKSYTIAIDGKNYEFENEKFKRDNGSGTVWEWSNEVALLGHIAILRDVATSKKTTIRFHGQQYYKDHVVSQSEKAKLSKILNAFDALSR